MKIDEGGLTNLVNKFKRDRIGKQEKHVLNDAGFQQELAGTETDETTLLLLNEDDAQEKNVLRVLIEFGLKPFDEEKTMADYIFDELNEFHFTNSAIEKVFEKYKHDYDQGLQPTSKTMLYDADESVRKMVINLDMHPFELSPNWDTVMEGMNINNRDVSKQDVVMSVNYFKLRKIKKMFEENQRDIEKSQSFDEQINLIKIHKFLKEEEQKITTQLGTVILK